VLIFRRAAPYFRFGEGFGLGEACGLRYQRKSRDVLACLSLLEL
jgi:hypothetical protein